MEKHFANYNQSLALKELGFNEICLARYLKVGDEKEVFMYFITPSNENNDITVIAPLKSQVFELARKDYNKLSAIDHSSVNGWYFVIREICGTTDPWLKALSVGSFKTYEEAESACIDELIKIVKDEIN